MRKLVVLVGVSIFCYGAKSGTNLQIDPPKMGTSGSQAGTVNDCSHLSQQEEQFARELSVMHRTMFCRHFSVSQRVEAMTLTSSEIESLTGQKTTITPDEAVEMIMKNARDHQSNGEGSGQFSPNEHTSNPYSNN